MTAAIDTGRTAYDVLVVGGGNAGISAAARLRRAGVHDVAVIEPNQVHTYRPLLSYVGGGEAPLWKAERTQREVTPRGCTWIGDAATEVDPVARTVSCRSGRSFRYRDLVVCPGLVPDEEALPGATAALGGPAVASNYLDHAEKTWRLTAAMPAGGRAVFTVPRPPVSCTATTIKPVLLAAAHWRRTGRLPGTRITLLVDRSALLGVAGLDERLLRELARFDVEVRWNTAVTAVDPDNNRLTVTDRAGRAGVMGFDMLHLVPPFRGPRWVSDSGLAAATANGLVGVDPRTLAHRVHPHVWALGDAATVDTDPSGGALRRQVAVLVSNLVARRNGGGSTATYDGYTVAPVATGRQLLIAGEYDRTGTVTSSLPRFLDPLKPRRSAWAFDRFGLPLVYWNLLLRGRV